MAVDVDAIKARVRIEDVVRTALGEMKREGRKLVACCPFHEEKTASFKVDVEEQFYKCFGCGAGGDVLDFVQKFYKCDFNAAAEKLGGAPAAGHVASKPTPPPRLALPAPAKPKTFFPTLEKLDAAAAYTASGKGGKVVARHDYPGGLFVYRIVLPLKDGDKKRKKMFLQGHSDQGGFVWGGVPISQPYHAEKLKDTPVVVLVEGEQKVEKLEALGFPARPFCFGATLTLQVSSTRPSHWRCYRLCTRIRRSRSCRLRELALNRAATWLTSPGSI